MDINPVSYLDPFPKDNHISSARLHMQSLGVSVASLSSWLASTVFTRSLGESEEQERDGFMTVDQEWKWDQVCGFPACSATSVSSKKEFMEA